MKRFLVKRSKGFALSGVKGQSPLPFLLLFLFMCGPAFAVSDPREMLHDPLMEARAEKIGSQLRCLVCQNQSIEDSDAELAHDLRTIVRERVKAGDSDDAVMAWMENRYGSFVRLKPHFTASTFLLWTAPLITLLAGFTIAFIARRRSNAKLATPLDSTEEAQLAQLLREP